MATIDKVREHMEIVGADGAHIGTVDRVEGDRIKMTKPDSGSHGDHHHYIPGGLVSGIEGNKVRLSANADNAILFEEEEGGAPLGEQVAGVGAAVGAYVMQGRRSDDDRRTRRRRKD